ncbi:MAG: hypothetical protein Q8P22_00760, partial [Chloroflexota bacterium]|nr:hypothetical protein [Chloroflexota bacterium]
MKWLAGLAALVVLATAVFPATALAAEPLPPHKDPAAVESDFDALSVFLFFGGVLDLLTKQRFDDVRNLLPKLKQARIPEDLRFIITRYAELLGALNNHLETADAELKKTSALLDLGQRDQAALHLSAAASAIDDAETDLETLQMATDTLARRLGALVGVAAQGPLKDAHQRLLSLLDELAAMRFRFWNLLNQLSAAIQAPLGQTQPAPLGQTQPAPPGQTQPAPPGQTQPAPPGQTQPAPPGQTQPAP